MSSNLKVKEVGDKVLPKSSLVSKLNSKKCRPTAVIRPCRAIFTENKNGIHDLTWIPFYC